MDMSDLWTATKCTGKKLHKVGYDGTWLLYSPNVTEYRRNNNGMLRKDI